MEFFNDYALLFAVSLPVVAIVGMQVFLFVAGERGTLLMPSLKPYPSIDAGKVDAVSTTRTVLAGESIAKPVAACNDEEERQAA